MLRHEFWACHRPRQPSRFCSSMCLAASMKVERPPHSALRERVSSGVKTILGARSLERRPYRRVRTCGASPTPVSHFPCSASRFHGRGKTLLATRVIDLVHGKLLYRQTGFCGPCPPIKSPSFFGLHNLLAMRCELFSGYSDRCFLQREGTHTPLSQNPTPYIP